MKFVASFCVCLLFCANVSAQEGTEVAPTQAPSNSVVDPDLTLSAQDSTSTLVTPDSQVLDSAQPRVMGSPAIAQGSQIQSVMPDQSGCGCAQTGYQPTARRVGQPYTSQVYSGNNFNRLPMQQYGGQQTYRIPQAGAYTSTMQPRYQIRYQQQYYYAPQPLVPVRRGLLFNRFRR